MTLRRLVVGILIGGWSTAACSADSAPEPEPTFRTPGAFLAARTGAGEFTLSRTLEQLPLVAGQDLIVITRYAPVLHSLDEARALAQSPSIPVLDAAFVVPASELADDDWQVVWFRSLTDEEREAL